MKIRSFALLGIIGLLITGHSPASRADEPAWKQNIGLLDEDVRNLETALSDYAKLAINRSP